MLERIPDLPAGVDGLRATGTVTNEDYQTVVQPLLDEARTQGRRLRLLYHFPPEFKGFTPGAAWEDTRVGLRYLRLFERCAVVTDVVWIRESAQLFGAWMPCPVSVFRNAEWEEALAWLGAPVEPMSMTHRLIPDAGVVVIEPTGPLTTEDFDALALAVDPWIETHGGLRGIVIHAREFPGWENPGSLIRHLRFVRDHHRHVRRVALCAEGRWASMTPRLAEHFVAAEIKQFGYGQLDDAIAWARAS